jgi:hypothetical protein
MRGKGESLDQGCYGGKDEYKAHLQTNSSQ